MAKSSLVYQAPPPPQMERRVYALPVDLVQRIHEYGFKNGHASEASAVRALLESALAALQERD